MRGLSAVRKPGRWGLGLLVLPLCACAVAAAGKGGDEEGVGGVVIASVRSPSTGAAAGLREGDVILSWSCAASPPAFAQPASGRVRSPFDLVPLEIEQSPRRLVTLRGRRGDAEMEWSLGASEWGIEARPRLSGELAGPYFQGKTAAEGGDPETAERRWRSAAESARDMGDARLAAWFLERTAAAFARAGRWPEADAAYAEAVRMLEPEPSATAHLLRVWGGSFDARAAWGAAAERFQKALEFDEALAPRSLAAARDLSAIGVMMAKSDRYDAAERHFRQALAIQEELAPGTTEVAASLNKLGILSRLRGDLAAADRYLGRAVELQRRLSPLSGSHALFLMNLGNVAVDRGDLERGEDLHRQALAISEQVAPDNVAGHLQNLAGIATRRGDLASADGLLRRILALKEAGTSDEGDTWRTLSSLGDLAVRRGDLETAAVHFRRALAIAERLSPAGRNVASNLGGLGEVALKRGDLAAAGSYLRRAQDIEEKLAPGSVRVAAGLQTLARHAAASGDLDRAEELQRRALAIFEEASPASLEVSKALRDLGELALKRGRIEDALSLLRRALELQTRLAPESSDESMALHLLGRAELLAGHSREGIDHVCRAIDVLDRQRARLGGTPEAQTSFEGTLGEHYLACVEGLIETDRAAEAFHVLERGRARSFLALLTERDLRLAELPPELAAERRQVNARYDDVQSRLAALSAGRDDAEIERLTGELRDLRNRQEEIFVRIRRESPRVATLEDPQPLDLARARAVLDPGTVLLAYAVGKERTWLFVAQPASASGPGLAVSRIAFGAEELRGEVESFRLLLKDPGSADAEIRKRGRRLYDLLVRPAETQIAGARRILVSADGPLHTLAFAALMRGDRFLVEWKPIHSVLSATVYAELTKSRPPQGTPGNDRLIAFGDPVYPSLTGEAAADPEVREAARRGLALQPLPASGREVKSIAGLYPGARVYLGREATEERAKAIGRESRLVHFACHGVIDERFPLNSALALTVPEKPAEGQDNGLLQAWEIFESLRLDADLVTLSACDTALGREMAGEGFVGLTRAFQYAGARSVLATLWGVSDLSTAGFMERFYGHLRRGVPKDEALRTAQIERLREQDGFSHPFHWAAFQLTGDWR
jgi:CHAT domain-containing protein/Tfp pilus assembly protein PilF